MKPEQLLKHLDQCLLWSDAMREQNDSDVSQAYSDALAVAALRQARGENRVGYKIGFTNRSIWSKYNVNGPIWGIVWSSTLHYCQGETQLALDTLCQPRIEPEIVFGFGKALNRVTDLDEIFGAIDWIAIGFEIVQSHMKDWRFAAAQGVADGGLHGRLLVGPQVPVRELAASATQLHALLAQSGCRLYKNDEQVDQGKGATVLDSPLHAVRYFLEQLRQSSDTRGIAPGDVVTTGTWTDAWPVKAGENWSTDFDFPHARLKVSFT